MDYTGKREIKSLPQDRKATPDLIIGMNALVCLTSIVYT